MNLHGGMQHGNDVSIRFPVATTKEDRSEGINIGTGQFPYRKKVREGGQGDLGSMWRLECLHEPQVVHTSKARENLQKRWRPKSI